MVCEFVLGQTQTISQVNFLQASKTYTKSSIVNFNQTLISAKQTNSEKYNRHTTNHESCNTACRKRTAQIKMFGTIHQHLKQYLIQIFPLTIVVKEQLP